MGAIALRKRTVAPFLIAMPAGGVVALMAAYALDRSRGRSIAVGTGVGAVAAASYLLFKGRQERDRIVAMLIPDGTRQPRRNVMSIAVREALIGVREQPNGTNWSTEPEGGIAKYNDYDYDPAAWCVRFAKWVMREAIRRGRMPRYPFMRLEGGGSTSGTKESAEELGIYYPVGSYFPRPGDIGIMEGHTFLVLGTSADGEQVNTVEGNSRNRVRIGLRNVDEVLGWINVFGDARKRPRFDLGVFEGDPEIVEAWRANTDTDEHYAPLRRSLYALDSD